MTALEPQKDGVFFTLTRRVAKGRIMLADRVGERQTEGKLEFDSEFDMRRRLGWPMRRQSTADMKP